MLRRKRFERRWRTAFVCEQHCVRKVWLVGEKCAESRRLDDRGERRQHRLGVVDNGARCALPLIVRRPARFCADAFKHFDGRKAADAVLGAQVAVLVRVDRADPDDPVELGRGRLPLRRERLAVATPWRIELDQPRLLRVEHQLLEVVRREGHHRGRLRRRRSRNEQHQQRSACHRAHRRAARATERTRKPSHHHCSVWHCAVLARTSVASSPRRAPFSHFRSRSLRTCHAQS
mmetsp:Transcript_13918/g.37354  ORF Transcript_13918/g.37354 Transcript_13918/m.37354 type:complete len:233 (-) Transcript_13918:38-736(-)